MSAVWQVVETTGETLWEVILRVYDNPFVWKIIAIVLAILVSFVLLSLSKVLAVSIRNKITKNFVTKWNKEIENVSALIWDIIFYALAMFSFFISFSIVGINVWLIVGWISIWVWFAFRQTLSNLISWIMIFTTKEYQPGSIISIRLDWKEIFWRIEEINMKNIMIRSFDFRRIVLPNSKFVTMPVKTYSLEAILKLEIEAVIDLSLDIENVVKESFSVVNSFEFIKYKEHTEVLIDTFDDKKCKLKIVFCFDPNSWLSTDVMKSQVQNSLINLYKKMAKKKE